MSGIAAVVGEDRRLVSMVPLVAIGGQRHGPMDRIDVQRQVPLLRRLIAPREARENTHPLRLDYRGFDAVPTTSFHYVRDVRLRAAVADFLDRERAAVDAQIDLINRETAFKREPGPEGSDS